VDGTGSESYPMVGFGISDFELSSSVATLLIVYAIRHILMKLDMNTCTVLENGTVMSLR
jgi:hypothetical protein